MATRFDPTSCTYLFNQTCGIWNQECRQGCGYIHLSSSTPCTRMCLKRVLTLIKMQCWDLPLIDYQLLRRILYGVNYLTNKVRNIISTCDGCYQCMQLYWPWRIYKSRSGRSLSDIEWKSASFIPKGIQLQPPKLWTVIFYFQQFSGTCLFIGSQNREQKSIEYYCQRT